MSIDKPTEKQCLQWAVNRLRVDMLKTIGQFLPPVRSQVAEVLNEYHRNLEKIIEKELQ